MPYSRVNWQDAPSTSTPENAANLNVMDAGIAALDTGKANLSGATFTGGVSATVFTATSQGLVVSGANQGVELGAKASPNTLYVDFNSSGNSNDYDVRVIASGGGASSGQGTLNIAAGSLTRNGNTVWDAGNDGPGSGLYADNSDKLDGLDSLAFAKVGSHSAVPFTLSAGTSTPGTLDHYEIFFVLTGA